MTDEEKAAVADLNRRLAAHCACACDLETGAIVAICAEHKYLIDIARMDERLTCATLIEGHEELGDARLVLAEQIRQLTQPQ